MVTVTRFLSAALLAIALLSPAVADAGMKIEGKPKASFYLSGSPGFLSIEGVTSTMTLVDDGTRLVFTVPMSTVSSGIALRDSHMNKNYVHVDQFPNVILDIARADVVWPTEVGKTSTGKAAANFTAHGVMLPTSVAYDVTKTKTGYRVKGKFEFNTTAHGMVIEPYMGVSFDPDMYATVVVDLADVP
jgi:YceI-like domain